MKFIVAFGIIAVAVLLSATTTQGQLTPSAASEGSCTTLTPTNQLTTWLFIFSNFNWYVPMGNQYFYRAYANVFLNQPANDQAQLDAMGLKINCVASFCSATGYSKFFLQPCLPAKVNITNPALLEQFNCAGTPGLGIDASAMNLQEITVLWSDNSNYVLLGYCLNSSARAWSLLSKTKTVDATTQATISNILQTNGFSTSYFATMSY